MNLYLIRHADAVPRGTPGVAEDARPLTDLGQNQARRLGELFARLGLHFDAIVTSPLPRAMETTEGMLAALPVPKPALHVYDEVAHDLRPRRVAKYLEKLGHQSVALVGHEPTLGRFLAWLIGSKKAQVGLEKAGFAKLLCDPLEKGGATLNWLITPDWF